MPRLGRYVYARQINTPAGTLTTAPQVTTMTVGPAILRRVFLLIPPGHISKTGFALRRSGKWILPFDDGTFIQGDEDDLTWDIDFEVDGPTIQVLTTNSDRWAHTHLVRLEMEDFPEPARAPAVVAVGGRL